MKRSNLVSLALLGTFGVFIGFKSCLREPHQSTFQSVGPTGVGDAADLPIEANGSLERDDSTTQPSEFVERNNDSAAPSGTSPAPRYTGVSRSVARPNPVPHSTITTPGWHLIPSIRSTSTSIRSGSIFKPSVSSSSSSSIHVSTSRGGFGSTGHAAGS